MIKRILRERAVTALMTRGVGSILQFGLNIGLGRTLGPAGLGAYYVFVAWVALLATISSVGLPVYTLRETAVRDVSGDPSIASRFVFRALRAVAILAASVGFMVFSSAGWIATHVLNDSALTPVLQWAGLASIAAACIRLFAEALKARGFVETGLSLEYTLPPGLLLAVVVVARISGHPLTVPGVVAWQAMIIAATLVATAIWFFGRWPKRDGETPPVRWSSVIPMWGIELVNNAKRSIPYLLLPALASAVAAGEFGAAHRLISISSTIVLALSAVFSPRFARHFGAGDLRKLARSFRHSQIICVVAYLPLFTVCLFWPAQVLGSFGKGFRSATGLLLVMIFGRLVISLSGLPEQFLNMTGQEKIELRSAGVGLTLLCALAVVLTPRFGALGMAWAFTISTVVRSLISWASIEWYLTRVRRSLRPSEALATATA